MGKKEPSALDKSAAKSEPLPAKPPMSTGGPDLGPLTSGFIEKNSKKEVIYSKTNQGDMMTNSHLANRLAAKNYRSATSSYVTENTARAYNFNNFSDMLNPKKGIYMSTSWKPGIAEEEEVTLPLEDQGPAPETVYLDDLPQTPEDVIFEILNKFQEVSEEQNVGPTMSKHRSDHYRQRWVMKLAAAAETPDRVLRRLCDEGDTLVRQALAENSNVPIDVIWRLVKDPDCDTRYVLAENPNVGMEVLTMLVEDDNPYVASRAQKTLKRMQGGVIVDRARFGSAKTRRVAFQ